MISTKIIAATLSEIMIAPIPDINGKRPKNKVVAQTIIKIVKLTRTENEKVADNSFDTRIIKSKRCPQIRNLLSRLSFSLFNKVTNILMR